MAVITFFKNAAARTKTEEDLTLEELADKIRTAHAKTKTQLPWLKLGIFGEIPSSAGSLRHDANMLGVSGGETDYDGQLVPMDEAERMLREAAVECLLYTSPSHRPDAPRWRVLFFFSEILLPERRKIYVGKMNDILGGVIAGESFRLSQAYYYGRVSNSAEFEVRVIRGTRIDLLDDRNNPFADYGEQTLALADVEARLATMRWHGAGDAGIHATHLTATASLLNSGLSESEVVDRVLAATRQSVSANSGWDWTREKRMLEGMCRSWTRRLEIEQQQFRAQVMVGDQVMAGDQVISIDQARHHMRDWTDELERKRGKHREIKPIHKNLVLFLMHHPAWAGVLGYDEFSSKIMLMRSPPWVPLDDDWKMREWTDADDLRSLDWFQRNRVETSLNTVSGAIIDMSTNKCRFHPVKKYLDDLTWDGQSRLNQWTRSYLGSESSDYARNIGVFSLISAVARVRNPACQVDTILILEGEQGTFKSTAIRKLFEPWFTDDIADFGSKDAAMQMRGAWCVEVSELDAMSRGEVSKVKAFITRQTDRFRPPYGKHVIEQSRQCVFMGTSNTDEYLRDETGNRRFWPLKTGRVDLDGLAENRDQLWAEADQMYKNGMPWWIADRQLLETTEAEQASRYVSDRAWADPIEAYLAGGAIEFVTMRELLEGPLNLEPLHHTMQSQFRVGRILREMGWKRATKRIGDHVIRCFVRKGDTNAFVSHGERVVVDE